MARSSVVLMSLRNMSMPSFVFDGKNGTRGNRIVHRIRCVEERKTAAGWTSAEWLATASRWVGRLVNARTRKSGKRPVPEVSNWLRPFGDIVGPAGQNVVPLW